MRIKTNDGETATGFEFYITTGDKLETASKKESLTKKTAAVIKYTFDANGNYLGQTAGMMTLSTTEAYNDATSKISYYFYKLKNFTAS